MMCVRLGCDCGSDECGHYWTLHIDMAVSEPKCTRLVHHVHEIQKMGLQEKLMSYTACLHSAARRQTKVPSCMGVNFAGIQHISCAAGVGCQ